MADRGAHSSDPSRPVDPLLSFTREHPGVVIATLSGTVVAAKVLTLANYQLDVALSVAANTSTFRVLLGMAVLYLSFVFILPAFVGWTMYTRARRRRVGERAALIWAIALSALSLAFSPIFAWLSFAAGIAFAEVVISGRWWRRAGSESGSRRPDSRMLLATSLVLFLLLGLSLPWLPLERVKLQTADEQHVGYVLGEGAGSVSILLYEPRTVRWVRASRIQERLPCTELRGLTRILATAPVGLIGGANEPLPRCFD